MKQETDSVPTPPVTSAGSSPSTTRSEDDRPTHAPDLLRWGLRPVVTRPPKIERRRDARSRVVLLILAILLVAESVLGTLAFFLTKGDLSTIITVIIDGVVFLGTISFASWQRILWEDFLHPKSYGPSILISLAAVVGAFLCLVFFLILAAMLVFMVGMAGKYDASDQVTGWVLLWLVLVFGIELVVSLGRALILLFLWLGEDTTALRGANSGLRRDEAGVSPADSPQGNSEGGEAGLGWSDEPTVQEAVESDERTKACGEQEDGAVAKSV